MPWMIHHQRNPELLAKASRRDLKKKAGSEERRNHHDEFRSIQILHNFSKTPLQHWDAHTMLDIALVSI